jgi:hypothetical protein
LRVHRLITLAIAAALASASVVYGADPADVGTNQSTAFSLAPLALSAQDAAGPTTPVHTDDSRKFILGVSPFLWLTGFDGTLGIGGVDQKISATFFDIVDDSDSIGGLTGALDFTYDRLVFQINAMWTTAEFSDTKSVTQNIKLDANLEQDASWVETFGGYRLIDKPLGPEEDTSKRFALDALVGARLTIIDVDAHLKAKAMVTLPDGTVLEADRRKTIDQTEAWIEPFIGSRIMISLDEHWHISVRGDVGGFDVDDSQFSWGALGLVGYRWIKDGWDIGIYGGYRAIGQDYTDHEFKWDIVTHGPVFGAAFVFYF